MKYLNLTISLLLLCLCLTAIPLAGASETPKPLFSLEAEKELIFLGAGALVNAGSLFLDEEAIYDPETSYKISTVNAFDRPTMAAFDPELDNLSTGLALSALLTPAVFLSSSNSEWLCIGTMYVESLLLTWGFKELGKNLISRDRPYMYFSGASEEELENGDFKRSFPSGHTALAFTGASFSSYVFSSYYPDSPWRLPVTVISYSLACGTGVLRIASGNHYLSDVLAGAALGTLSGVIVPWLHKNIFSPDSKNGVPLPVSLFLSPDGFMMMYSY